eukprot:NODE_118_length_18285_cov_1.016606.p13 type:complete len:109 gc:universal NODE_118_length_18285_cov_1.016606:1713-2039(+)
MEESNLSFTGLAKYSPSSKISDSILSTSVFVSTVLKFVEEALLFKSHVSTVFLKVCFSFITALELIGAIERKEISGPITFFFDFFLLMVLFLLKVETLNAFLFLASFL